MLTPYDEFPVHQAPYPFSHIPATDTAWDDGYYFGVFSPEADVFIYTGMRINPNTNMVGGYAGIAHGGRQYTARFSRQWRPNFDLQIGPFRYQVIEPFKDVRVSLEPSADGGSEVGLDLGFDFHWLGAAPAFEEEHHLATTNGRRTTDQTRYSQAGRARGTARFGGKHFKIEPATWFASRDHSWGIYSQRAPIATELRWLPPREVPSARRAFRFWTTFVTSEHSGFYHLHESQEGEMVTMNDTFGTPFEGHIHHGWDSETHLRTASHALTFRPGTRVMDRGVIELTDDRGGVWRQKFTTAGQPWSPLPVGYHIGTWRDGGTLQTYHGPGDNGVTIEADDFDIGTQPFRRQMYNGMNLTVWGAEYVAAVELTDPQGNVTFGAAQIEIFLDGRYDPYGFTAEGKPAPSYWGGFAILDDE